MDFTLLSDIEEKIKLLIQKNQQLSKQVEILQADITERDNKIQLLNEKNNEYINQLKNQTQEHHAENIHLSEKEIDELVNEIDRCINLLNN